MTRWNDWAHAIVNARGQWLPGDPRGFRNHDHRVHSSGDYRSPPPEGEHRALRAYAERHAGPRVVFAPDHRSGLATCLGGYLLAIDRPARIIAVSATHAHILFRCGNEDAKRLIAGAKQSASHRTRQCRPGSIWAQGCHIVRIKNEGHYRVTVDYISHHRAEGAALWGHPSIRLVSDK